MKDEIVKVNHIGLPAMGPPEESLCPEDEEEMRQQCRDLYEEMSEELMGEVRWLGKVSSCIGPS
ncbi:MAG: hypothetical protein OEY80_10600 [Nitrospirota bacterium]|nr:hypothetical protein [Nitrospirota bacterium]